MLQTSVKVNYI